VRIIYLNCWYAKTGRVFFDFVKENSLNTDIFCFQEVSPALFSELGEILFRHCGFSATGDKAIFVKNCLKIAPVGKSDVSFLQVLRIKIKKKELFLGNVHGKARPGHKLDTPARLRQSRKIIKLFLRYKGPKIIGGDFNLSPETKSIRIFEERGYWNLVKDFGVKSTRNRLVWDDLKKGEEKQYFADYVFVSPEVKVGSFSVPDIEISDHLPLILDFEV